MEQMTAPVKRGYDASRRRAQARENRARVLDAARRRFLEAGYGVTTLAAIAADADVSVETIYKAFGNKAGLLKSVCDVAIAGDDEPVPIMERDFVARNIAEPDPREKLRMYAEHLADSMPRVAPIYLLARAAAGADPDIAATIEKMNAERLTGMTAFAQHLDDGGHLRDVSRETARDVLWTYNSPELYELLVLQRAWPITRYREFVADALIAALVG